MTATSSLVVTSPVNGDVIAEVVDTPAEVVAATVEAMAERQHNPRMRALLANKRYERCVRLDAAAKILLDRLEEFAADLVFEHGKPLGDAKTEIIDTASELRLTASFARSFGSSVPPLADPSKRVFFSEEPVGVVGAITPWNFPFYIPVEYLAPALAMGNSVVWKPAETTPLSNRNLLRAFREAGFDENELAVVEGGPLTGAALVRTPSLAALCFTGSSEVGREIRFESMGRPLLLELGGNGPTVVLADADISLAAQSVASAAFWASGQSCGAAERILVQAACVRGFVEALHEAAQEYFIGDPRDKGTTIGPLHLEETAMRMARHVADASARGGRLVLGGRPSDHFPTDRYWLPTILVDVHPESEVFLEETFGPIAPVTAFSREEDLFDLAGFGGWGLVGAVFGRDLERTWRVADGLPCGLVLVNDSSNYWEPQLPVGGGPGTRSGIGRLGLENVLRFMSATKVVAVTMQ